MFADPNRQTTVTELITTGAGKAWGINDVFDYLQYSPFGMQPKMPERYVESFDQRQPIIAALVTGQMPRAFGSGEEVAPGEDRPECYPCRSPEPIVGERHGVE